MNKTTLYPKIEHDCQWYIIDADSKTLGRLATEAAKIFWLFIVTHNNNSSFFVLIFNYSLNITRK